MVSPRIFMSKTSSEHWKELSSRSPRNSQLVFLFFKNHYFLKEISLAKHFTSPPISS